MVDANIIELLLMYFVMPLWIAAGLADWACHRTVRIEDNAGPKESLLHLLMLVEIGIPVCAVLFLQVNASIILLVVVAFVVHQLTALWDLRYAARLRFISPIEQQAHSFLEILPLMAGSLVIVLHWQQFLSLFGVGDEAPDFSLQAKERPLPVSYVVGVLGAVVLLQWVPYLEELWRGLRARHSRAARIAGGM